MQPIPGHAPLCRIDGSRASKLLEVDLAVIPVFPTDSREFLAKYRQEIIWDGEHPMDTVSIFPAKSRLVMEKMYLVPPAGDIKT